MFITTFTAKCRNFISFAVYIHENPFGVCIIYQKALNSNVRALKVPNVEASRHPLQSMSLPPSLPFKRAVVTVTSTMVLCHHYYIVTVTSTMVVMVVMVVMVAGYKKAPGIAVRGLGSKPRFTRL